MRDYGRVFSNFWTSHDIGSLSDDGRLLALYLLTGPHGTISGVCRLPDGYVCEDMKWPSERVAKGFRELFESGFAKRCESTKWVWICKFLDWNKPENPNQWKAARRIAQQVPGECAWKAEFLRVFAIAAGDEPPPAPNPSGTLPKGFRNQEQQQQQDQEQQQNQEQQQHGARAVGELLEQTKACGAMSSALRALGVDVTSFHPTLDAWVREGFTIEQLTETVATARMRPGKATGTIAPNYLDAILRKPQRAVRQSDGIGQASRRLSTGELIEQAIRAGHSDDEIASMPEFDLIPTLRQDIRDKREEIRRAEH